MCNEHSENQVSRDNPETFRTTIFREPIGLHSVRGTEKYRRWRYQYSDDNCDQKSQPTS